MFDSGKSRPVSILPNQGNSMVMTVVGMMILLVTTCVSLATLAMVVDIKHDVDDMTTVTMGAGAPITNSIEITNTPGDVENSVMVSSTGEVLEGETVEVPAAGEPTIHLGENYCAGMKPYHANATAEDNYFSNVDCLVDGVLNTLEQAGANVTAGYVGEIDAVGDGRVPITDPYFQHGLCPVNVHWHLGAEHLSVGEFDENGDGPSQHRRHLLAAGDVREGFLCHHYDASDPKFTTPYEWKHCDSTMMVGQTYEVHWPHSAAGACGTPNQYQTPFYDGVFCNGGIITLDPLNTYEKIGVQSQVYTIVNDEDYYYPDMIRGMIVDGDYGADIAKYTGSTTGTTRDNEVCSRYTPITWQVDRKCHLISASSFDKMCADMKAQRDDMSDDLYAHGARELVADHLAANNQAGK